MLGVIFLLITMYQWKIHERLWEWLGGVGFLFILVGLFLPQALGPLYGPWMRVAEKIGYVMNRVILTIFYLLIFTPIALVRRLFHRDPLSLRWDKIRETYFEPKVTQGVERFENLF